MVRWTWTSMHVYVEFPLESINEKIGNRFLFAAIVTKKIKFLKHSACPVQMISLIKMKICGTVMNFANFAREKK